MGDMHPMLDEIIRGLEPPKPKVTFLEIKHVPSKPPYYYFCPECDGEGRIEAGPLDSARTRICPRCDGKCEMEMDTESALACGALTDRLEALARLINEGWPITEAKEIVARWLP